MNECWKLKNSATMELNEALVAAFREYEPSVVERDINLNRTRQLRDRILAGQAIAFCWAVVFLRSNGKTYRMNGNHSSLVLSKLNGEFPKGLTAHIDQYEVDNHEMMALLFRQFDASWSVRSALDKSGAYQKGYDGIKDVDPKVAKLAAEGYAYYRQVVDGVFVQQRDDRYTVFREEKLHPYIRWMGEQLTTHKAKELMRVPVAGAMVGTFMRDEPAAREFWEAVVLTSPMADNPLPFTKLDHWLLSSMKKELTVGDKGLYQGCIYAWNMFRTGASIDKIRFDWSKGPLHIL